MEIMKRESGYSRRSTVKRKLRSFIKKIPAFILVLTMVMGNLIYGAGITAQAQANDNEGKAASLASAGKYQLGINKQITQSTIYNETAGYGWQDVTFPNEAVDWVNGVYYPRVSVISNSASYVTDYEDYTQIRSKVWTETESTTYGVYTYEETSTLDFDLTSKDYIVSVELINPTEETLKVSLEAEDITKVSNIVLAAGESSTQTFTACLIDGRLNLKFLETSTAATVTSEAAAIEKSVYVKSVTIQEAEEKPAGDKPTIFIASDSTVQTYDETYYPQKGWGESLHSFFGEYITDHTSDSCDYGQAHTYITESAIIENRAIGGRSSKSFIEEGKLDDLLEDVKPGDYVLVQWAHNDATASRPNRYVSSEDFEKWIQLYIDGVEQRGGTCVLVTPVARYSYTTEGGEVSFVSNFDAYRQVMIKMAREQGTPILDLTNASIELCNSFGIEGAKSLFLWLAPGEYNGLYAAGVSDSTHLQYYGAYKFAQCVARLIEDSQHEALSSLKELVQVAVPDQVPDTPSGLETGTIGASSVSLTWESADSAELYYIYRQKLEKGQSLEGVDFTTATKYSATSNTKYTDSGCEGESTYAYAIRAFNEKGLSELSDIILAETKASAYKFDFGTDTTPYVMDGWTEITRQTLYSAASGYGWITVPGADRYRKDNGNEASSPMADDFILGEGEFAVDLRNGTYEITIYAGDLLPGTSTIKASYTAEGDSIGSISARQSIGSLSTTVSIDDGQLNLGIGGTNPYINGLEVTPLLYAPAALGYSELDVTETQANFLISFVGIEEAISYNIYRKGSTDKAFEIVKVIEAAEILQISALPMTASVGEIYQYYVTAVTKDGTESAPSNMIEIEMLDPDVPVPAAPVNVRCIDAANANISIQWDAVDTAISYNIYRSSKAETDKGFKGFVKVGSSKSTTFVDTSSDVYTYEHYYYKVQAVNTGGSGELSEVCESPITYTLKSVKSAETLKDRALVAVNLAGDPGGDINLTASDSEGNAYTSGVYLSWRSFEGDSDDVSFTIYKNGSELENNLHVTNLVDMGGTSSDIYKVVGSTDAGLGLTAIDTQVWDNMYLEVELYKPEDQTMPDGTIAYYNSNDMSVGDLDGDGQLELIVKWMPSNSRDNGYSGYSGTTILDAYDINMSTGEAELFWRIDLGVNIRSGAHYTQFQVWDFDGDGKAEIAMKTADGTTTYKSTDRTDAALQETGHVGACNADALPTETLSMHYDYRNTSGYILTGPEYFTMFNGLTGEIIDTTEYLPGRGDVESWGDLYGNRVDRFLSAVAYLDGNTPYAVFCRGYYTRATMTAYCLVDTDQDGIGDHIGVYWEFNTDDLLDEYDRSILEGQGNHNLSVNDVDGDGKDEIVYGALVIDDNGTLLYSTGLGHGDAMHVSDWVLDNPGLEVMSVHEHEDAAYHVEMHDALTGEILMGYYTGKDTGRGVAGDIDPTSYGAEFWSIAPAQAAAEEPSWNSKNGGVYSTTSTLSNLVTLTNNSPASNFTIFWDGDLLMEILDHDFDESPYLPEAVSIAKWDYENSEETYLLHSSEVWSNNGTKGNAGLAVDILGDWREEIIVRLSGAGSASENDNKIRIYTTTIETDYVVPCLLENRAYREGIAWQNVAYNQPANLDYLLSEGVITSTLAVGDVNGSSVQLQFTTACDGTYGGEIEAYEIYRTTGDESYELIDTIETADLLSVPAVRTEDEEEEQQWYQYTDSGLTPKGAYTYKIAAVVNGKTSYRSHPLSVTMEAKVQSVYDITLEDIVQDTPLEAGQTVADLLPSTVAVKDIYDEEEAAGVTWDVSNVDISVVGTYTVIAHVENWSTPIEVELNIIANEITGYTASDINTIIGVEPQLPDRIAVSFLNGTTKDKLVSWDISTLDYNRIGEYVVKGTLSELNNYAVVIKVLVQDNYIISVQAADKIIVECGTAIEDIVLPATLPAEYADGRTDIVSVSWNTEELDTSIAGTTFILEGKAEGFADRILQEIQIINRLMYLK